MLCHHGPEILVNIGFDDKWRITLTLPPIPDAPSLRALIDTGARESCIDRALAERLALPQVDRRFVRSVAGLVEVDYFRAQVHIPSLHFALSGPFAALPLVQIGFKFEALLGRTFLEYVRVEYDGPTGTCDILRDA